MVHSFLWLNDGISMVLRTESIICPSLWISVAIADVFGVERYINSYYRQLWATGGNISLSSPESHTRKSDR